MATIAELRAGLGSEADSYTDEQLYNAYKTVAGPKYRDEKSFNQAVGWDPEWDFGRGMRIAGRGGLAAGAGAGAALADTFGLTGARDSALAYGREQQQKAFQLGRRSDDVDNFTSDPLSFLSSAAGQGVVYAVPSLVGGGVGALGARALGARALAGYAAGAGAVNLGQETGGIYNELAEQGRYEPGRALAFGLPAAALDTVSELIPGLGKTIAGGVTRRMGLGALRQAGVEAGTETAQTAIERAGAYKDVTGPEAWHEYRNAAALGAVGGGMFGGAMGLAPARRTQMPGSEKPPVSDALGQPTDLLDPTPLQLGHNGYFQQGQGQSPFVVFPDGSTATQADAELMQRYGMTPDALTGLRQGGPRVDPAMDTGDVTPYLPGKMVADEAGTVALDALGAESLYGREDGDPGLALARERYLEQTRQAEQRRRTTAAIQEAAQTRTELAQRTKEATGVDGTRAMDLFAALERQRDAGLLGETDFVGDAALISTREFGKVAKNVKARDAAAQEQANAAGAGTDGRTGPADVGGGAGNQRAPAQPGRVQPAAPSAAAQAVDGAGTAGVGSRGAGSNAALTPQVFAAEFPQRVQQLNPLEQAYLSRWLGVELNDNGELELRDGGSESLTAMAKTLKVSRQAVHEHVKDALAKIGMPPGMRPRQLYAALGLSVANTDAETIDRNLGAEPGAENVVDDPGVLDEVVGEAPVKAGGQVVDYTPTLRQGKDARYDRRAAALEELPEAPDQDPTGRQREAPGFIDESTMDTATRVDEARALTLESALEGDFSAGRVTADDVAEAQYFYDQNRQRGMQPWGRLDVSMRAAYVRTYARARLAGDPVVLATKKALYANTTSERAGAPTDTGAARDDARGPADGGVAATEESRVGDQPAGPAVQAPGRPAPTVTVKRKRQFVKPEPDVNWGDQAAQMSRDTERDGDVTYHTAESLEDSLLSFMNEDALGKRVIIVNDPSELTSVEDQLAAYDDGAVAWARNGRAYLIADRIPVGKERGVFMHEVGGHLGLERLLGEKEYSRLVGKLVGWASRNGGNDKSQESVLARKAKERVDKAGTEGAEARNAELVAYFLEEAVNAGLNPTAMQYDTPVRQWLRTLWAAFKVGLRRLGVSIDKLTAQDVVNLGYGAARLTITGRFHGTAADVQQFRTKYIGTGEGAQAYGWGLYFSELRGVAEDYKKSDVKRKSGGVTGGNKDASQFPMWAELKDLATGEDYLGFDTLGEMLRGYLQDHRAGRDQEFLDSYDISEDLRSTLVDFGRWWFKPAQQVQGNLYATDIAVKPDEFLDWTKSLGEQSPLVRARLKDLFPDAFDPNAFGASYWKDWTGGQAYRDLEVKFEEARNGELENYRRLQEFADARPDDSPAKLASMLLDSIGVKGVRMPVNYTSGGTYDSGQNFVVFNEKNVIKALDNPASRVSKSVQFSKSAGPANAAAAKIEQAKAAIRADLPAATKDAITNIGDAVYKYAPYLMSNFQLLEQFGDRIKSLGQHIKLTELMTREATRQQMAYDAVGTKWETLRKKSRVAFEDLNKLMTEASRLAIHPDHEFGAKDWNDHLPPERKADHARLKAEFDRLGRTYPEAITIYHEALKVQEDSWNAQKTALEALYDKYGVARPPLKKVPGPYFPLQRHGDYLVVAKSQEMRALEDSIKGETDPTIRKEATKVLDEMSTDPKHYWMSAHESRAAQKRMAEQQQATGNFTAVNTPMAAQRLDHLPANVHRTVTGLSAALAKHFDSGTVDQIEKAVSEMLLRTLPEGHALERQAQRRGVSGSNPDMLRSFMSAGRANAFYTARTLFAKDLATNMQTMRDEVAGKTKLVTGKDGLEEQPGDGQSDVPMSHVFREIEKRVALDMQFKDTPIQNTVNTVSWLYHLGVSPAFLAMNALQPALVSFPVLAGRFGAASASKELGAAWAEALQVLKAARFKDGKWSPWDGITADTIKSRFPTINEKGEPISEERKAIRELMLRGIVDEGLVHDVGRLAEGNYGKLERVSKITGWASQQIELMNRVSTALATFRLARTEAANNGMDPKDAYNMALEEAYRATVKTQIDYSAEGAPRVMRTGGGVPLARLIFQFRRYQQGMLYLLMSNARSAWGGDKQAMATLGYLGVVTAAAGGAIGLPFANAVMWAADKFIDDDDEEGDAETRLRNMLFDMTGDRKFATVLAKGLPAMWGMDMAKRIGMGDVATLIRMDDIEKAKTERDKMGQLLLAIGGPSAGAAARIWEGANLMSEGDLLRGFERALPKFMGDPVQSYRLATQGMTDRKGEQVLTPEQLDVWDKAYRFAGVTPTAMSNIYEGEGAKRRIQTAITERKTQIHREYRRALRSGDFEDVRAMIDEFNDDHPDARIKPKDEVAWRKDAQKAESQRGETGIKFNPRRDAAQAEVMRFARE